MYVIGGDIAEGLPHGDFTSLDVVEQLSGEQVAQWHGNIHPEQAGDLMAAMGKRYNLAWLVPERNNNGLTTVTRLVNLDYKRLYVENVVEHPPARPRKRYGFVTSSKTKPLMINQMVAELDDGTHGIKCKETFGEMLTFKHHDDGKLGAIEGAWDDRVLSMALASYARRVLPMPAIETRTPSHRPAGAHKSVKKGNWKGHT